MNLSNLRNEKSAKESLDQVRGTIDGATRTQYFEIQNQTRDIEFTLVLAEGYQENGQIPQGYEKDTGLTVTGINVIPGTIQKGVIQPQIDVLVTHAKCSLHWKRNVQPYDEGDFHCKDLYANPGEFFTDCAWAVVEGAGEHGPKLTTRHSTAAMSTSTAATSGR